MTKECRGLRQCENVHGDFLIFLLTRFRCAVGKKEPHVQPQFTRNSAGFCKAFRNQGHHLKKLSVFSVTKPNLYHEASQKTNYSNRGEKRFLLEFHKIRQMVAFTAEGARTHPETSCLPIYCYVRVSWSDKLGRICDLSSASSPAGSFSSPDST